MSTRLRQLSRAFQLSPTDWFLTLQAWFWLLFFDLWLRLLPFPELQTFAANLSYHPNLAQEKRRQLIHQLTSAVDRARLRHLYPMTCLRRSLALQKLLAQSGIAAELKIGVSKPSGTLSAHAWLEIDGRPIGEFDRITELYAPLRKG